MIWSASSFDACPAAQRECSNILVLHWAGVCGGQAFAEFCSEALIRALQLGHRPAETRVPQAFRCLFPSRPVGGMAKVGLDPTHIFFRAPSFFPGQEIDRSLAGRCEGKRHFLAARRLRENAAPLGLRGLLMHVVWPLPIRTRHLRLKRSAVPTPSLVDGHSRIGFGYRSCYDGLRR